MKINNVFRKLLSSVKSMILSFNTISSGWRTVSETEWLPCTYFHSATGDVPAVMRNYNRENVMTFTIKTITSGLAGGAVIFMLSMPVSAAGLGVGVGASVGGSGGINAGVGASVGGSGGINAGVGASVGGANGVNAGAGANVGGTGGVSAGLGADVGGAGGIGVGAGVGVGNGVGVGVGVGVGTDPGAPGTPSAPGTPGRLTTVVAQMSDSQVARMKKRCADVLSDSGVYDRDLRQLCLLIARR
ncbi:hypothetical protein LGH82_31565 [Mesorhizobium sp. PAMC28654]|uniref:hypothetical protein n=1 Tax=Mesorhizobium sp. PAMC28654 TaxID=2880934 RepID=UPI001D09D397|nr:hypothetical protein [Mesorhizobium sp. PAMC28654]UDL89541.1 hypothetical protein LGH82_31565 [Mesorhizobium sp. PAMC28654]